MPDKRALVVGIGSYDMELGFPDLLGAVSDARTIGELLETHHDGSPNWQVTYVVEEEDDDRRPRAVGRRTLTDEVEAFFDLAREHGSDGRPLPPTADLFFYFSGHATRRRTGQVELSARDGGGIDFTSLMAVLQRVHARSVTLVLDCCHSGNLARQPLYDATLVAENLTILAASRSDEDALEDAERGGLFSERLKGGLRGAAADLLGNVTALSLYAHASGAFAEGHQRPTFKSHSVQPVVLRRAAPQVPIERLAQLTSIFGEVGTKVYLTEAHEGDETDPDFTDRRDPERRAYTGTAKQIELDHLKAYRDAHLVVSDDGRDFYFLCTDTVRERKSVSLTPLGRYFWELTNAGLLDTVSDAAAS